MPPPSPIDATLRVPTLEFHAPPVDAVVTNVRYTLDRQFGPLVNFYLQDEVAAFGRGEDTAVGELFGTVAVTAEEARRVYAKDPAAGDRRLLGRHTNGEWTQHLCQCGSSANSRVVGTPDCHGWCLRGKFWGLTGRLR